MKKCFKPGLQNQIPVCFIKCQDGSNDSGDIGEGFLRGVGGAGSEGVCGGGKRRIYGGGAGFRRLW